MTSERVQLSTVIRRAATDLVRALAAPQVARMVLPLELEGERTTWFYTPTDHGGLPMNEMTPRQQEQVHKLLAVSLSAGGHHEVNLVMGLENVLAAETGFANFSSLPVEWRTRDPGRYFVAFFGDPESGRWGWRFGGHHVSLNFTLGGDDVRVLPTFLGANPVSSHGLGPNVLRMLAGEQDLGRGLVRALRAEQRAKAILSTSAPADHVTGRASRLIEGLRPSPFADLVREPLPADIAARASVLAEQSALSEGDLERVEYTAQPKGLAVADMDASQLECFYALLRQYLDRMPAEIAASEMERARAIDPTQLTFAWAGGTEPGEPHYYRVQGTTLLIEYDNVQDNVNHIHTVWRDPTRDFGRDLLAEHYTQSHVQPAG